MADPVSWKVIEVGWNVVASDGTDVGYVDAVTGDDTADIFNGLAISKGPLSRPKYVPSEAVGTIVEGRVELSLSAAEVDRLGEYEEAPESAQILPDSASAIERASETLVGSEPGAHPTPLGRRMYAWLASLFRGRS